MVAVAVKTKSKISTGCFDAVRHVMQHFHRFGIWVVVWEIVIQFIVAWDHFNAEAFKQFMCKGCGCSVAYCTNELEFACHFEVANKVIQVSCAYTVDEFVFAAFTWLAMPFKDDIAQFVHLVRAVGEGALKTHLHSGPTVWIVAGCHHGNSWRIKVELAEIGHW